MLFILHIYWFIYKTTSLYLFSLLPLVHLISTLHGYTLFLIFAQCQVSNLIFYTCRFFFSFNSKVPDLLVQMQFLSKKRVFFYKKKKNPNFVMIFINTKHLRCYPWQKGDPQGWQQEFLRHFLHLHTHIHTHSRWSKFIPIIIFNTNVSKGHSGKHL